MYGYLSSNWLRVDMTGLGCSFLDSCMFGLINRVYDLCLDVLNHFGLSFIISFAKYATLFFWSGEYGKIHKTCDFIVLSIDHASIGI